MHLCYQFKRINVAPLGGEIDGLLKKQIPLLALPSCRDNVVASHGAIIGTQVVVKSDFCCFCNAMQCYNNLSI